MTGGRPTVAVFDHAGVLTESMFEHVVQSCTRQGLDPRRVVAECFTGVTDHHPVALVEVGAITDAEFVEHIATIFRRLNPEADAQVWYDEGVALASRLEPRMMSALSELRRTGARTALLSNSWCGREHYPLDRMPEFDDVILSGEVGLRKPDPAIFELACRRLGAEPRECFFVDDQPANVAAAESVGMRAHHHVDVESTLDALRGAFC